MEGTKILIAIISSLSLLVILYAETHYKFKYFFSFLRKKEPEIIADAPFRINPNERFPLLILVKDANLYPCIIHSITAILRFSQQEIVSAECSLLSNDSPINDKWWWKVFWVEIPKNYSGIIECDVVLTITVNGKRKTIWNDNYRTASHKSLKIYIADTPLPTLKDLQLGEIHSHSSYTEDQVEFGAPIEPTAILAKALGLSFVAITDHSYDLDDFPDNYLKNHPEHPKWYSFLQDVKNSSNEQCVLLYGEEVSCRNINDKNVHTLVINNGEYIPGSGDGAEKWFQTRSEHSLQELPQIAKPNALIIAAHPCDPVSLLQSLLLNRGQWSNDDFFIQRINGIQFLNGTLSTGYKRGYELWIKLLLHGKKIALFAGNDAHGNFNRYRQIMIPFFLIHESSEQIFGKIRTGIFSRTNSREDLVNAAMMGRTIVTDGPVANISLADTTDTLIGNTIPPTTNEFTITALSSKEFGSIETIRVYAGRVGAQSEVVIHSISQLEKYSYNFHVTLQIDEYNYFRIEAYTSNNGYDNETHFCLTSPVWIQQS